MSAVAAIDINQLDIKGKALNSPAYNLLGGKSRDRVRVYCHVTGVVDLSLTLNEVH